MFSLTPGSFSATKHVMPLYRGSASGSVLTSTNTRPERSPFVTHIFWPLISYVPSSCFFALALSAWTSEPISGSDRLNAARSSPVAICGSHFWRCSSVPYFISRYEPMKCVLTIPEIEIQPRESSSTIIT